MLCDTLLGQGEKIEAVIAPKVVERRAVFSGISYFDKDEYVYNYSVDEVYLVNGIGALPGSMLRAKIYRKFESKGYVFPALISEKAFVSKYAQVGRGAQVLHGAVVQSGVKIGDQCIVNTRAIVEHDCELNEFNHIAPNAVLCGGVTGGKNVYVGANATVIQCVSLGDNVVVGAGAVVTKAVANNTTVYPAKNFQRKG